jgi:parallel beta-helix repeat protein
VTTAAIVINASTPVHVTSDGARLLPGVDYDVFRVTTSSLGVVTFRGFMVFYGTRASVSGVVFRFLKAGALGSGVMDCMVENGYTNISFDGVDDQNCIVSNFVSNGAVGNGIQFLDGFGGNSLISNTSMSTDTLNNGNGILMRAGDGNLLSNVQIQGFLTGFNGTPTAGQLLLDLYCVNVEIDNGLRPDGQGGNGWYFNGSAGGAAINGVYLTNCWGSGNYLNSGWYFNVATNIVMQGCIAVQNGQAGIYFTASCNNVIVQGCLASGNNRAASAFSGIQFSAGMILFSAIGNRCGSTPRAPTASQTYGIAVATGASDHYVIQGNVVQGNVTGGVADGGTGSFKSVSGNVS